MNYAFVLIDMQIVIVNKILQAIGIKSLDRIALGRRPPSIMLRFSLLRLSLLFAIEALTIAIADAESAAATTAFRIK